MSDTTPESAWVRGRIADAADAAPTARAGALLAVATGARLRDAAARAAIEAALAARSGGVGWDEVYEALFNRRFPDGNLTGAEAAFYYCTTGEPWPPGPAVSAPLMALWTCQGCLHRVADIGPWEGPAGESGHASDCPRHETELLVAAQQTWAEAGGAGDDGAEVEQ